MPKDFFLPDFSIIVADYLRGSNIASRYGTGVKQALDDMTKQLGGKSKLRHVFDQIASSEGQWSKAKRTKDGTYSVLQTSDEGELIGRLKGVTPHWSRFRTSEARGGQSRLDMQFPGSPDPHMEILTGGHGSISTKLELYLREQLGENNPALHKVLGRLGSTEAKSRGKVVTFDPFGLRSTVTTRGTSRTRFRGALGPNGELQVPDTRLASFLGMERVWSAPYEHADYGTFADIAHGISSGRLSSQKIQSVLGDMGIQRSAEFFEEYPNLRPKAMKVFESSASRAAGKLEKHHVNLSRISEQIDKLQMRIADEVMSVPEKIVLRNRINELYRRRELILGSMQPLRMDLQSALTMERGPLGSVGAHARAFPGQTLEAAMEADPVMKAEWQIAKMQRDRSVRAVWNRRRKMEAYGQGILPIMGESVGQPFVASRGLIPGGEFQITRMLEGGEPIFDVAGNIIRHVDGPSVEARLVSFASPEFMRGIRYTGQLNDNAIQQAIQAGETRWAAQRPLIAVQEQGYKYIATKKRISGNALSAFDQDKLALVNEVEPLLGREIQAKITRRLSFHDASQGISYRVSTLPDVLRGRLDSTIFHGAAPDLVRPSEIASQILAGLVYGNTPSSPTRGMPFGIQWVNRGGKRPALLNFLINNADNNNLSSDVIDIIAKELKIDRAQLSSMKGAELERTLVNAAQTWASEVVRIPSSAGIWRRTIAERVKLREVQNKLNQNLESPSDPHMGTFERPGSFYSGAESELIPLNMRQKDALGEYLGDFKTHLQDLYAGDLSSVSRSDIRKAAEIVTRIENGAPMTSDVSAVLRKYAQLTGFEPTGPNNKIDKILFGHPDMTGAEGFNLVQSRVMAHILGEDEYSSNMLYGILGSTQLKGMPLDSPAYGEIEAALAENMNPFAGAPNTVWNRLSNLQHLSGTQETYPLTMHTPGGAAMPFRIANIEAIEQVGSDGGIPARIRVTYEAEQNTEHVAAMREFLRSRSEYEGMSEEAIDELARARVRASNVIVSEMEWKSFSGPEATVRRGEFGGAAKLVHNARTRIENIERLANSHAGQTTAGRQHILSMYAELQDDLERAHRVLVGSLNFSPQEADDVISSLHNLVGIDPDNLENALEVIGRSGLGHYVDVTPKGTVVTHIDWLQASTDVLERAAQAPGRRKNVAERIGEHMRHFFGPGGGNLDELLISRGGKVNAHLMPIGPDGRRIATDEYAQVMQDIEAALAKRNMSFGDLLDLSRAFGGRPLTGIPKHDAKLIAEFLSTNDPRIGGVVVHGGDIRAPLSMGLEIASPEGAGSDKLGKMISDLVQIKSNIKNGTHGPAYVSGPAFLGTETRYQSTVEQIADALHGYVSNLGTPEIMDIIPNAGVRDKLHRALTGATSAEEIVSGSPVVGEATTGLAEAVTQAGPQYSSGSEAFKAMLSNMRDRGHLKTTGLAIGAVAAGSLAYRFMRTRDQHRGDITEEKIAGPPNMPGGSTPYGPTIAASTAIPAYTSFENIGPAPQGVTYVINARSNRGQSQQFMSAVQQATGSPVYGNIYGVPSRSNPNGSDDLDDIISSYSA